MILGIGIGFLISGLLTIIWQPEITDIEIENMARQQGMVYPEEVLPFNLKEGGD